MAFDTDAYIRDLAAAHGLAPKPGDAGRADLTERAVRAELSDIKRRTRILHTWSAAVIADHQDDHAHPADDPAVVPTRPGCRCALRRPDRRPGCRCTRS
jgi:hypothetical protein